MQKRPVWFFLLSIIFCGFLVSTASFYILSKRTEPTIIQSSSLSTIPFSLEKAPSNSISGILLSWSGQILYESRIATQEALLTSVVPVEQGESFETKSGAKFSVLFSPIATLSAEPKTKVSIVQAIPEQMVFEQNFGKITYQVSDGKKISVRTLHALIEKSNGSMVVTLDTDTKLITIIVKSGTAVVGFNDSNTVSTLLPLASGDTYIFHDDTRIGHLQ